MTTLSSKGSVKSANDVTFYKFEPPVQVLSESRRTGGKNDGASAQSAADWNPAGLEKTAVLEQMGSADVVLDEAEQRMLETSQLAEEILRDARAEAEQLKSDAAAQGYRTGYEKGFKEGVERAVIEHGEAIESRMEEFGRDIEAALTSVREVKEKCLRAYLEELKDCAVAVAEKVIHISLRSSGEIIKRMIIAETERLKKTAWVKIYMEKTDYEMMMETDEDVIGELSRLSDNIKFIVMDKDDSGNCIIEMPDEIIDISVNTQLDNIKEILQNVRI